MKPTIVLIAIAFIIFLTVVYFIFKINKKEKFIKKARKIFSDFKNSKEQGKAEISLVYDFLLALSWKKFNIIGKDIEEFLKYSLISFKNYSTFFTKVNKSGHKFKSGIRLLAIINYDKVLTSFSIGIISDIFIGGLKAKIDDVCFIDPFGNDNSGALVNLYLNISEYHDNPKSEAIFYLIIEKINKIIENEKDLDKINCWKAEKHYIERGQLLQL